MACPLDMPFMYLRLPEGHATPRTPSLPIDWSVSRTTHVPYLASYAGSAKWASTANLAGVFPPTPCENKRSGLR